MQQATDQTEASLVLSTHDELNAFAQNMRQQARFDYFNLKNTCCRILALEGFVKRIVGCGSCGQIILTFTSIREP